MQTAELADRTKKAAQTIVNTPIYSGTEMS